MNSTEINKKHKQFKKKLDKLQNSVICIISPKLLYQKKNELKTFSLIIFLIINYYTNLYFYSRDCIDLYYKDRVLKIK